MHTQTGFMQNGERVAMKSRCETILRLTAVHSNESTSDRIDEVIVSGTKAFVNCGLALAVAPKATLGPQFLSTKLPAIARSSRMWIAGR